MPNFMNGDNSGYAHPSSVNKSAKASPSSVNKSAKASPQSVNAGILSGKKK